MTVVLLHWLSDSDIVQQKDGKAKMSFTSTLLDSGELSEQEDWELKWSAASLYGGKCPFAMRFLFTPTDLFNYRGV